MRVSARASRLRLSPQKARLVVDLVRGKHVSEALEILSFTPKKAHVIASFRLERSDDVDTELDEAGVVKLAYDAQFNQYRVRVDASLKEPAKAALVALAQKARASFSKGA